MLLNIIILLIIAICLAVIGYIVFQKIPRLKTLDVGTVPRAQADAVRNRLLFDRFQRGAKKSREVAQKKAAPFVAWLKNLFVTASYRIFEMEKKYKRASKRATGIGGAELNSRVASLLAVADKALKEQDWAGAEKNYLEVISLAPKSISAYEGMAEICEQNREYKQALQARQFVLKLLEKEKNLDNVALSCARHDLGLCHLALNAPDKALVSFQSALALQPNNPRHLDKIIETSILLKNKPLALEMLARLTEVNPENQSIREYEEEIKKIGEGRKDIGRIGN